MDKPVFTIIMPSYNSEKTIEIALRSIREQTFDQNRIEILVIDGGSGDKTLEIAKKYNATILHNPDRLPEYAKRIGILQAKGDFAIEMDTDEELIHVEQLAKRFTLLQDHPEVSCLAADRLLPVKGYGVSCAYLNRCGDPLSQFVYRRKNGILKTFQQRIVLSQNEINVLHFEQSDLKPIGDGGTTLISMRVIREQMKEQMDSLSFATSAFESMLLRNGYCGCIQGDDIRHYSSASFKTYLAKLRFRLINNIFHKSESGFSVREEGNKTLSRRKKLFVFYAASLVAPLFDSLRLATCYRDMTMLLHFFYVYYVCVLAAFYYGCKLLGISKANKTYAK